MLGWIASSRMLGWIASSRMLGSCLRLMRSFARPLSSGPETLASPSGACRRTMSALDTARHALLVERRRLHDDELEALAALPAERTGALGELAHEVRLAWCGDTVEVEGILSAKTGGCPEDCHFCAQSAKFETAVKAVPLLSQDEVLAAARETAELGATEFCLVYAVRGPDERLMAHLEDIVPFVGRETGLNVAVSAGILDADQAAR